MGGTEAVTLTTENLEYSMSFACVRASVVLAACLTLAFAADSPWPADRAPVPAMTVIHRVSFTGLKDFSQELPAGQSTMLDLPADLPPGKPSLGELKPITQSGPLRVEAITPAGAAGSVSTSTDIGGMAALSFRSAAAPGMTLRFRIDHLTPGGSYAASALISARAEAQTEGARMRVSGQGLAPREHSSPSTTPAAPRVRQLLVAFVAPADGVVNVEIINPRADELLHLRSLDIRTHAVHQNIIAAADLPQPGHRFDFTAVTWTDLHVAADRADAADTNDATAAKPLRTLGAALAKAQPLLRDGIPVRIVLAPEVYREGPAFGVKDAKNMLFLDATRIGGKAAQTPLAIIGSEPGKVIISGADRLTDWTLADAERNLWRAPWTNNWGPTDRGFYRLKDPIGQRSEVLSVNGKLQQLRLIEVSKYERGVFIDYGPGQSRNEKGRWTFEKYLGPEVLEPGEFAVSEFGPGDTIKDMTYDGHPDPNTLWLRLPPGVDLRQADVEVGFRIRGPDFKGKNQVHLRNLEFRHYLDTAFRTNGYRPDTVSQNYLVEHCTFTQNLERGAYFGWISGLTVTDCTFNENGRSQGATLTWSSDALLTRCTFDRNGWRDRDAYGMWMAAQNARFVDCSFSDNAAAGIWQDVLGVHLTFESCRFNRNRAFGAEFEIGLGPIVLRDCEASDNGRSGLWFTSSSGVLIERCRIVNNVTQPGTSVGAVHSQIQISPHPRVQPFGIEMFLAEIANQAPYCRNYTIRDSIIAGRGANVGLIGHRAHEEKAAVNPAYIEWYKTQLTASGNTYWQPDNATPFDLNTEMDPARRQRTDVPGWQHATGQDRDSRWQEPQQVPLKEQRQPEPAKQTRDEDQNTG